MTAVRPDACAGVELQGAYAAQQGGPYAQQPAYGQAAGNGAYTQLPNGQAYRPAIIPGCVPYSLVTLPRLALLACSPHDGCARAQKSAG